MREVVRLAIQAALFGVVFYALTGCGGSETYVIRNGRVEVAPTESDEEPAVCRVTRKDERGTKRNEPCP